MSKENKYFSDEDLEKIHIYITNGENKSTKLELPYNEIPCTTKKLKTTWTVELAQDLEMYHQMNAESEIQNLIKEL